MHVTVVPRAAHGFCNMHVTVVCWVAHGFGSMLVTLVSQAAQGFCSMHVTVVSWVSCTFILIFRLLSVAVSGLGHSNPSTTLLYNTFFMNIYSLLLCNYYNH